MLYGVEFFNPAVNFLYIAAGFVPPSVSGIFAVYQIFNRDPQSLGDFDGIFGGRFGSAGS